MLERTRLLAATLAFMGLTATAHAVPAIGLTGSNFLFDFDTAAPTAANQRAITGLQAGETVFGLDFRPSNAALYGLGSTGRLYTINAATGAATVASTLSMALSGASFDIAFNPTVDRLRVVSNTGQNLRINVDTGAVTTDTPLAYAAGDANAGATPNVQAAAYTNQVSGTVAATVLYDIDITGTGASRLVTQNPPNGGALNTVAALGVAGLTSFDIDGNGNAAYAATGTSLYTINLTTGATTLAGNFGLSGVSDFAVVSTVPEPMSLALLGMGLAGMATLRRRGGAAA